MDLSKKSFDLRYSKLISTVFCILSILLTVYLGADVLYRTASILTASSDNDSSSTEEGEALKNTETEEGSETETEAEKNAFHAVIPRIFDSTVSKLISFFLSLATVLIFDLLISESKKMPFSAAITALTARIACQAVADAAIFAVGMLFPDTGEAQASGYLIRMIEPTVSIASAVLEYIFALAFVCLGIATLRPSMRYLRDRFGGHDTATQT